MVFHTLRDQFHKIWYVNSTRYSCIHLCFQKFSQNQSRLQSIIGNEQQFLMMSSCDNLDISAQNEVSPLSGVHYNHRLAQSLHSGRQTQVLVGQQRSSFSLNQGKLVRLEILQILKEAIRIIDEGIADEDLFFSQSIGAPSCNSNAGEIWFQQRLITKLLVGVTWWTTT